MKKSLTLKMFTTTFIVITLMLTLVLVTQYIYFDMFYEKQKISNLISEINTLSERYMENQWDEQSYIKELNDFNNNNNAYLSVHKNNSRSLFNSDSDFVDENFILITSLNDDSSYIDMVLTHNQFNNIFQNNMIDLGTSFTASGYYDGSEFIVPTILNGVMIRHDEMTPDSSQIPFQGELKIVEVIDFSTVQAESLQIGTNLSDLLPNSYDMTVNKEDGVDYIVTSIPFTNITQVDLVKTIKVNGDDITFSVNASLHSVTESTELLKSFFPYFLLITFIITTIVSILYSKSVSKPIVEITNKANLMSNLDFSNKLELNRSDELGLLATSINKLSSNLEESLNSLSDANNKLTIEYENEVKQEKARKEFVANVSHEIKSPLGVIKSYTEGIRDSVKKEKISYYIDVILDEVSSMDDLVVELLDLAKFDAGKVEFAKADFEVKPELEKCIQSFSTTLVDNNQSIRLVGSFGEINGDKKHLYRVFSNLIHNAIKYATNNSVITIEGQYENRQTLIFSNEYSNISKEDLPKLWQRFYKADVSHNRNKTGTGLGLSIVKSILDGHQADYDITLESNIISFNISF